MFKKYVLVIFYGFFFLLLKSVTTSDSLIFWLEIWICGSVHSPYQGDVVIKNKMTKTLMKESFH